MKSKYSFISTASVVLLSLTIIVAEVASAETLLVNTHAPLQESKASPINAAVVPAVATVASSPLQAKVIDSVGKVKWRTGADIAWKDAKEAAVNDLLSAGAEVRTGLRSRMTLKFENATILIDSNSNFAMPTSELVKESDGDVYRTVAQMKSGRADFQVDKVGAKNDFKVVTPSSTLAVRGTGFSVATGAMTGTEVTGARTNAIAAIQLKYAATNQVVQMSGGGDSKSSSASPEPAASALMSSIGALPMAGTATSAAEHEASASMGTTQTTAQTQISSTVATVAAAVTEAAGGSTEPETGDSAAAINAYYYENLAQSSAGAFLASADAFAFRVDADVALGNTIFARDSALQARVVDAETLTTVLSSLFDKEGVSLAETSLAETQFQMVCAKYFSNEAYVSFLATTYNNFESVFSADASATQSKFSADASKSAAIETQGYADMASQQAAISQQAGNDYSVALAQANAFASDAGTAAGGATDAAAHAEAFSQAATNFALVIGSAQANSARDFARAALAQADVQRDGAVASRDAALVAADEARSGGDRVFFIETAKIAADTVYRADRARIFADQALQAATNARIYADNASVVALGVGTLQTVPPPNPDSPTIPPNCHPGQTNPPSN